MAVTTPEIPRVAARVGARTARLRAPRSPTALVVALLAACTYAVFADGAVGLPQEPRLQIGLALIAALTAGSWLLSGTIALRAPTPAWIGVALLALFAAWSGLTLLWSVAPDRTWAELNRGVAYTLVVVLGIAAGASAPKAIERIAVGWLAVALVTAGYALGGKVIPGVDVFGLFDFDHTLIASRLRAPLEYWNALALVCVLGVPVALRLATDMARGTGVRLFGLCSLFFLITTITMSYSRGGLLALVVAIVVMTMLGGARLRGLAVVGAALLAVTPVLALAFSRPALTDNGVPLDDRIPDGALLGLVMFGCLIGLLIGGWGLLRAEERIEWSPERSAKVWRRAKKVAIALGILWFLGAASAEGGLGGVIDRAWDDFTKTSEDKVSDPARIVSSNSGNRWVWWEEAAGAFSDRPLHGWGAGSFPVTHKIYREVELGVSQPHNVPLQFLAETGLVGATLALGAIGLLLWVGLLAVRGSPRGRERELGVALLAGGVAWTVHGLYDWDWDIPGVTVPALLFLGVLAGASRGPGRTLPRPALPGTGQDTAARATVLVGVCLALGLVMVSAGLPAWSDSKASSALAVSTDADERELSEAAAEAETSSRLDPTALRGLLAAASIAEGRDRLVDARGYLLDAVERQPYSTVAWQRLLALALKTADREGARAAAGRLLELDPIGTQTRELVERLQQFSVPAGSSPTATGTPLSPAAVAPPVTGAPPPPGAAPPPAPGAPPVPGRAGAPAPGAPGAPPAPGAAGAAPAPGAPGARPVPEASGTPAAP